MRRADPADFERIYALLCDLEEQAFDPKVMRAYFLDLLSSKYSYPFVYEQEGQVVGYMTLIECHYLHHCAKTFEIVDFVIDPSYRSQGIGSRFFSEIEAFAKAEDGKELSLVTNKKRKKAHAFYERHGMKQSHFGYTKNI